MSSRGGRRRYQGGRGHSSGDMAVDQPQNGSNANNNQLKVPHVEIRNWEVGTVQDVCEFLSRKSHVKLQNAKQNGPVISIQIPGNQKRDIQKWNGVRYGGNKLDIRITEKTVASSPETARTIQILEGFLQSRYNPQVKMLNLGMMMSDQTLQSHNLLDTPEVATKMFKALMKLAGDKIPQIESISLESNNLADTSLVLTVAETYPSLLNLSLANNHIQTVANFLKLKNRLPMLRELVISGNPIQMHPAFQSQAREIVGMFPRLLILDGVPVRNEADLPKNSLAAPILSTFFEDEGVASIAPMFLTNFFGLWDTNREGLLPLYDQASLFSLCYNAAAPHLPTSKPAPSVYIQLSRNLEKSFTQQTRHNKIFVGTNQVAGAFRRIPASKHDLTNAAAYAIDAWKVTDIRAPGDTAIMMVVHGEFAEPPSSQLRSFDRTLVVLPGPNGSYIVASDMLNIRSQGVLPISSNCNVQPPSSTSLPQQLPPQAPPQVSQQVPQQTPQQTPQQQQPPAGSFAQPSIATGVPPEMANNVALITQEFMRQTGLTAEFADMCLKQANYNPTIAFELFQQSRAQLPPNAFQQQL